MIYSFFPNCAVLYLLPTHKFIAPVFIAYMIFWLINQQQTRIN
jgi:hypothetical protein